MNSFKAALDDHMTPGQQRRSVRLTEIETLSDKLPADKLHYVCATTNTTASTYKLYLGSIAIF